MCRSERSDTEVESADAFPIALIGTLRIEQIEKALEVQAVIEEQGSHGRVETQAHTQSVAPRPDIEIRGVCVEISHVEEDGRMHTSYQWDSEFRSWVDEKVTTAQNDVVDRQVRIRFENLFCILLRDERTC